MQKIKKKLTKGQKVNYHSNQRRIVGNSRPILQYALTDRGLTYWVIHLFFPFFMNNIMLFLLVPLHIYGGNFTKSVNPYATTACFHNMIVIFITPKTNETCIFIDVLRTINTVRQCINNCYLRHQYIQKRQVCTCWPHCLLWMSCIPHTSIFRNNPIVLSSKAWDRW